MIHIVNTDCIADRSRAAAHGGAMIKVARTTLGDDDLDVIFDH